MEGKIKIKVKTVIIKQVEITVIIYTEKLMAEVEKKYIQIADVLLFNLFNQLFCQLIASLIIVY